MTERERLVEAFGRGLAQGLTGSGITGVTPAESSPLPPVIPMDSIKQAVRDVLEPLIAEDERPPTQQELDLYTHGIEDVAPDGDAERIRLRVEEARQRAEEAAEQDRVRPGTYDPNAPNLSGWTTPQIHDE